MASQPSKTPVVVPEGAGRPVLSPIRVAYLVGGRVPVIVQPDWTQSPRPEYVRFAERNASTLFDYSSLDQSRSSLARLFQTRGWPHAGLAVAASNVHRDYDAYLVSGEDVGLPLALAMRLRGIRTPIYIITHGSYFRSAKFRRLMRLVTKFPGVHFLCLADSLRLMLLSRFHVNPLRAHNAGYGVDVDFFKATAAQVASPLIVSAGTANRDYSTLVGAVAGLNTDVKIAADSAWFPTAVDISVTDLPPNIEARSFGNYRCLRDLYDAASFVVVPLHPAVHASGFAVIIEAMAMGKAVIATQTDACSDFIIEGETGCYVPPGDADALRAAIRKFFGDPEWVRAMGANARRMIEEKYSLDAYCERIERIVRANHREPVSS